jgi:hypothetical protein
MPVVPPRLTPIENCPPPIPSGIDAFAALNCQLLPGLATIAPKALGWPAVPIVTLAVLGVQPKTTDPLLPVYPSLLYEALFPPPDATTANTQLLGTDTLLLDDVIVCCNEYVGKPKALP